MAKRSQHTETSLADAALGKQVHQIRIPLVEETVQVSKRVVDTGKGVRVHKTVSEHAQVVDLSLLQDELTIEHIAVDMLMTGEALPAVRYEGETMIVPVFEEVLLVQKQVRLKEEIHITRRQRERHAPQTILLKTETATVVRFEETPTAAPTSSSKGE